MRMYSLQHKHVCAQTKFDERFCILGFYIGAPDRPTMAALVDRLGYVRCWWVCVCVWADRDGCSRWCVGCAHACVRVPVCAQSRANM